MSFLKSIHRLSCSLASSSHISVRLFDLNIKKLFLPKLKMSNVNVSTNGNEAKRPKITNSEIKKIGTHDGVFHCDEVLACFMLKQLPEYKDAEILRSRNNDVLSECDIVVDVGGIFDIKTHRYDHHQNTFKETLNTLKPGVKGKWDIKLSSAGLVYVYFGERIIKELLINQKDHKISDDALVNVYRKVYENFIREIDGIDNGVPMFDGEPKYNISTNLSSRVGNLNPEWTVEKENEIDPQILFESAMKMCGEEFCDKIFYYSFVWWPARELVNQAIEKRFKVHASGEILELKQFCPWKEHLFELEQELNIVGIPKYVISETKPGDWRIICVPIQPKSFVCRKFLTKSWRGVRDDELANISGIPESRFCHATGFIGGASSREGVLQMAIKSLEQPKED